MSDEELLASLEPGMMVRYDEPDEEWLSPAEGDPMLVLEVGRVKDLKSLNGMGLEADWRAAYVLRSDGIRRAYSIDTLRLVADEEDSC